ncbi:MAG: PQQ-like beta-propeller repeat protein [Anaerolineales bacterium]|jgi:outer membrane protein assembly factor BamB|nr:PQQ-like beta-propeller repeat protein [Anaerolineales bacterium]
MKRKQYIFILVFIGIAITLSACAGAANTGTSWPGLTVDEQFAYVAHSTQLYAVDLVDGREVWRYPSEPDNSITFYADPELTGDGQVIAGGYDFNLYSLDAETGNELWVFPQAENRYIAAALVDDGSIFAPAADENLYALDSDGRLQWTFTSEGESWAQPVTDDECSCLFLSSMDHTVYAIDPLDGTEKWRTEDLGGAVVGTPAYNNDGVLYVGTFGGKLFALDAENGEVINEFSTKDSAWIWSGPTLADSVLYFGDLNGNFYEIDAETLTQNWIRVTDPELDDEEIVGSPLVIDQHVYFANNHGYLYKYSTDGVEIDAVNVDPADRKGKIYTSPKTSNGLILVATVQVDELLVAYDEDLKKMWEFIPEEK